MVFIDVCRTRRTELGTKQGRQMCQSWTVQILSPLPTGGCYIGFQNLVPKIKNVNYLKCCLHVEMVLFG